MNIARKATGSERKNEKKGEKWKTKESVFNKLKCKRTREDEGGTQKSDCGRTSWKRNGKKIEGK
jgi:hypothetical protein